MKKVIAVLLLLTMCIGIFAGCKEEVKEDPALASAAEYLYTMYKDNKEVTSDDYTVVSQVRIDGVTYPITWTTDKADNVKISAGENGMMNVVIEGSAEEVTYKLTATLKNEAGQTVSVTFTHIIPAKAVVTGKTMVLAYPKENKFITGSHYLYTGKNKWQLELTENEAEAIALQVVENSDGSVTLVAGEYYLFCDATHVQFVKEQGDYTKFILEQADTEGGYFLKCAVANYNGKAQYLEVYSGYLTCYGMGTDPSIYVFKLQETTTAAGSVSGQEGGDNTNPDPQPSTPATPSTPTTPSTPATQPTTPPATQPSTPSTPAATYTQVTELKSGDKVVIVNPNYNMALSMTKTGFYNVGIDVSGGFGSITKDEIFTVTKNGDGSYKFVSLSGKVLALADEYASLNDTGANDTWEIVSAGGKNFYLKNVGRNAEHLEWYASKNNWSTYHPSELSDEYVLAFYVTNGTGGSGSSNSGSNSGNNGGSSNSGNSGSTSVSGKLAASLDMTGTTNLKSVNATQTIYSANGITFTNDKASSTTDNYSSQSKYSARAYKGSTVKIEYTGMTAIVIKLDDYEYSGKTYMAGFDGMTIEGATISREGTTLTITFAKATNVFQSAELGSQTRINSIEVYTA